MCAHLKELLEGLMKGWEGLVTYEILVHGGVDGVELVAAGHREHKGEVARHANKDNVLDQRHLEVGETAVKRSGGKGTGGEKGDESHGGGAEFSLHFAIHTPRIAILEINPDTKPRYTPYITK